MERLPSEKCMGTAAASASRPQGYERGATCPEMVLDAAVRNLRLVGWELIEHGSRIAVCVELLSLTLYLSEIASATWCVQVCGPIE